MLKKAVKITIPEGDYSDLKAIAESRGNDASSLAAWIVTTHIDTERRAGRVPSKDDLNENFDKLKEFLEGLAKGIFKSSPDLTALSIDIELDKKILISIQNCYQEKVIHGS
jgi:hypothetical protein